MKSSISAEIKKRKAALVGVAALAGAMLLPWGVKEPDQKDCDDGTCPVVVPGPNDDPSGPQPRPRPRPWRP